MSTRLAEIWEGMQLRLERAERERDEARTSLTETTERLRTALNYLQVQMGTCAYMDHTDPDPCGCETCVRSQAFIKTARAALQSQKGGS